MNHSPLFPLCKRRSRFHIRTNPKSKLAPVMNTSTHPARTLSRLAMRNTRLPASLALAALIQSASALPADLDMTFNGTGQVTTAVGGGSYFYNSVAIQRDEKIVVASSALNESGNYDFAVVRYNTDGSLDTDFGAAGKVTTAIGNSDDSCTSIAMQRDGKIVVSGYFSNGTNLDIAVLRYNPNGSLDTTFNGTGKVTTAIGNGDDTASAVLLQPDGKIVVGGSTALGGGARGVAVLRYDTNGSLDTTFNGTGKVTTAIGIDAACISLAIQNDGKLVASGASVGNNPFISYDFTVVRYNTDGSLDPGFNGSGKVTTDFGGADGSYGVAVQSDGKIVAVGLTNYNSPDFILARYNTDGSLDTTFGGTGKVATDFGFIGDFGNSIAIQHNGKIIIAGVCHIGSDSDGNIYATSLARYNPNGSMDTTFNGNGKVVTEVGRSSEGRSVAVQSDGRIVVAGLSDSGTTKKIAVIRYQGDLDTDGDGLLDWFETRTGVYVSPENTGTSPTSPDSDNDGLNDGTEVFTYHSNPILADTDLDSFLDGYELQTGHSMLDPLDKPALVAEARTAIEFTFPAALGKIYRIEASTDLETWAIVESGIAGNGSRVQRFYSTRGQPQRYFRVEEDAP